VAASDTLYKVGYLKRSSYNCSADVRARTG
ncbi:hypothetical protein C5167_047375, partial [Papaver somniferum]